MARMKRQLTNNEILKPKSQENDFALHDGNGLCLLIKTSDKNHGFFAINGRRVATIQISALAPILH